MKATPAAVLRQSGTPAMLISNLTNIRYITGLSLSAGLLLVQGKKFTLFVDDRYTEAARLEAKKGVVIKGIDDLVTAMKKIKKCAYESREVTISRLALWKKKFKSTKFIHKENVIEYFRRQKDSSEIRLMKKSHAITENILSKIPRVLRPGISELEVAWKIETWARELGAEKMSFDPIVGFGPNTSRPHHHPGHRKLRKNDIVQIDMGVSYQGYCSDRSAVYCIGRLNQRQSDALAAVLEAKETAKKAARKGASVRALDRIARDVLKRHGMEQAFTHSLGHGIGLDVHEGVTLSEKAPDETLLAGEVITIEPGVYFPGSFGVRLEDQVFVL